VAMAAGFGSVRRFNATIRGVYDRTPTQIRKLAHCRAAGPESEYVFRLRFRGPLDWDGMLGFQGQRAIPGVEAVDQGCYRRTISLNGSHGTIQATLDRANQAVAVRIRFGDPRWLFLIVERVRRLFDLNADPFVIAAHLRADSTMRELIGQRPGVRVPGCWDGFELAVRAVLGQQVTVKGASTLAGRLVREFGTPAAEGGGLTHLFPSAAALAHADLTRVGLPGARAETIRALARAVSGGRLSFSGAMDRNAFLARFRELPGIGDWTAQYVAMRALDDPDAFPSADLGLLRAAAARNPKELEQRSAVWRPWRAYAAIYLWQATR